MKITVFLDVMSCSPVSRLWRNLLLPSRTEHEHKEKCSS